MRRRAHSGRGVGGLGHIGSAVHPVGDRRPVLLGNRLDEIPQAFVLADGDGEADSIRRQTAATAWVEKPLSARMVSCPLAPPQLTRLTVSRRKWAAPVPAATASSG